MSSVIVQGENTLFSPSATAVHLRTFEVIFYNKEISTVELDQKFINVFQIHLRRLQGIEHEVLILMIIFRNFGFL